MIATAKEGKLLLTPWFDLITKSSMFYTWYAEDLLRVFFYIYIYNTGKVGYVY